MRTTRPGGGPIAAGLAVTFALSAAGLLGGCGSDADDDAGLGETPQTVVGPTTVAGALDVSVEEGPVGDDGVSEVNFGSIELDDGFVLVEIPAALVRAAGLTRDELVSGGRFELDLSGAGTSFDPRAPTYLVDAIRPVAPDS